MELIMFLETTKCREGICNIVGDQSNNKVPQLKSSSIYNHLKGLIGSNALIEVKCLYSCSDLQVRTIEEVLEKKKNTCLMTKNNQIQLKRNHRYYHQVQGQLNICQREKCYFVVYINDEIEVYIEEIKRDEYFWRDKMLPKLIKFYTECIAPEIIRGNLKKIRSVWTLNLY
ncbi:hypothetical protein NQ315_011362 [Exocentrus adspersus]|uniref:YqaJ viral recombinase domain-containing protein n=1 Tax=Exocentrus adspersus TaxID=1586481 RepID=A0AAV8V4W1_9CUCU|nr:hypothetical protein NQ315_011362 [Exocentrus adspersus]